jgi:hypothetical protein
MSMSRTAGIVLPGYDPLRVANAPTIGTATVASETSVSVAFTPPSCVGGGAISSYRAYAACGVLANTGASSPIVVSGLTTGTAYTFKVVATNVYGPSYPSAASNSVTPPFITCAVYSTAGTYSWVAPAGVTSVAIVAVGGGGTGWYSGPGPSFNMTSGAGGGLGYKNAQSVTPGTSYTVVVGAAGSYPYGTGGTSYFISTCVVRGGGGSGSVGGSGGTYTGTGGGNGGNGLTQCIQGGVGGGGAGGYSGNGGAGSGGGSSATAGSGGGGGGGFGQSGYASVGAGNGGGVGLYGSGSNGAAGTSCSKGGKGGSGGGNGGTGCSTSGGAYGGGGAFWGTSSSGLSLGFGSVGAVRIVWCSGGARGTPSFPSTNVGAL